MYLLLSYGYKMVAWQILKKIGPFYGPFCLSHSHVPKKMSKRPQFSQCYISIKNKPLYIFQYLEKSPEKSEITSFEIFCPKSDRKNLNLILYIKKNARGVIAFLKNGPFLGTGTSDSSNKV